MDGPRTALHTLRNLPGATKQAIRVGRGRSSRRPKTAGRGHKGAGQHASNRARLGFEGGQTPLYRRQPKRGFKNPCVAPCQRAGKGGRKKGGVSESDFKAAVVGGAVSFEARGRLCLR